MNKKLLSLSVIAVLASSTVWAAQEAPTPRQAPRIPVQRQVISERKHEVPPRQISGTATIVDNERLRLGRYDVRLFGVVPPQVSASYGAQARAALDHLTTGQTVTCSILDRAKDGRLLAQCTNSKNVDIALDLLRRGLAMAARGSLGDSALAAGYIGAEQAAQSQKVGLWSLMVPEAVPVQTAKKPETAVADPMTAPPVPEPKPEPKLDAKTGTDTPVKPDPVAGTDAAKPMVGMSVAPSVPNLDAAPVAVHLVDSVDAAPVGILAWMQRLQVLLATLVASFTAFGVMGLHIWHKRRDRRGDMAELAAALRGELMAARAIVQGRLRDSAVQQAGADVAWPRVRATLYQASVARLGLLGADLARQVSSIYGQAHDYAAFYNSVDTERASATPKRQALQTLAQHIEAVLPRLERLERKPERWNTLPRLDVQAITARLHAAVPAKPIMSRETAPAPTLTSSGSVEKSVEKSVVPTPPPPAAVVVASAVVPAQPVVKSGEHKPVFTTAPTSKPVGEKRFAEDRTAIMPTVDETAKPAPTKSDTMKRDVAQREPATTVTTKVDVVTAEIAPDAAVAHETTKKDILGKAAVIAPLWVAVREFAQERFSPAPAQDVAEDPVTDYAKMIEEEMATLGVYDHDYDDGDDAEDALLKRMRG